MMRKLLLLAAFLAGPVWAQQVPNPINAPDSVTVNHLLGATANRQKAADLGLNGYYYGTGAGTANVQTITSTIPTGFTLASGVGVSFTAAASNTNAATLAVNGTTATAMRVNTPSGLAALAGGEIIAGNRYFVQYDGTFWVLQGNSKGVTGPASSTNGDAAIFSGTSGDLLSDAGAAPCLITGSTCALGSSTATTQSANDNSTKLSTTAYVDTARAAYCALAGCTMVGTIQASGWSLTTAGLFTTPQINLTGGGSAPSWTTAGIGFITTASTWTDTTSSGTVANEVIHSIAQPTLAASSATTFTQAFTFRIGGAPIAGTGATITNSEALIVGGNSSFNGFVNIGNTANPAAVLNLAGSQSAAAWGTNGINFRENTATFTDTSSATGTVANNFVNVFGIPTLAAANASVVYTNADTVVISGCPIAGTNVSITNCFAFRTLGGMTVMGGLTSVGASIAVPLATLYVTGAQSATTWTTSGTRFVEAPATYTDTTAATGTTTNVYMDKLGVPTIAATNTGVIYTNAFGIDVEAPVAGTNVTITNPFAARFTGNVQIVGTATSLTGITSSGTASLAALTASSTVTFTGLGTDTGTDNTLCLETSGKTVTTGTGTLGICLGTSSARFKRDIISAPTQVADFMNLQPKRFRYIEGQGDNGARVQQGFLAEDVFKVFPDLVRLDDQGRPNTLDGMGLFMKTVPVIQDMERRLEKLERKAG